MTECVFTWNVGEDEINEHVDNLKASGAWIEAALRFNKRLRTTGFKNHTYYIKQAFSRVLNETLTDIDLTLYLDQFGELIKLIIDYVAKHVRVLVYTYDIDSGISYTDTDRTNMKFSRSGINNLMLHVIQKGKTWVYGNDTIASIFKGSGVIYSCRDSSTRLVDTFNTCVKQCRTGDDNTWAYREDLLVNCDPDYDEVNNIVGIFKYDNIIRCCVYNKESCSHCNGFKYNRTVSRPWTGRRNLDGGIEDYDYIYSTIPTDGIGLGERTSDMPNIEINFLCTSRVLWECNVFSGMLGTRYIGGHSIITLVNKYMAYGMGLGNLSKENVLIYSHVLNMSEAPHIRRITNGNHIQRNKLICLRAIDSLVILMRKLTLATGNRSVAKANKEAYNFYDYWNGSVTPYVDFFDLSTLFTIPVLYDTEADSELIYGYWITDPEYFEICENQYSKTLTVLLKLMETPKIPYHPGYSININNNLQIIKNDLLRILENIDIVGDDETAIKINHYYANVQWCDILYAGGYSVDSNEFTKLCWPSRVFNAKVNLKRILNPCLDKELRKMEISYIPDVRICDYLARQKAEYENRPINMMERLHLYGNCNL